MQKLSAIISNSDTTFSDPVIIDIEATYHLYQQGIVFLDARDKEDFEKQHILGAVNIPWHDIDNYEDILDTLNTFQSYVIYCSGGECSLSMDLAYYMLEDFTFDKIFIYEDGMPDWLERGYPVE